MNILVVDDDETSLLAVETVLSALNQRVYKGTSAREALRLVLQHDFAAILLDVKMPEMDGFECARLIRARERSAKTPIIFLTGMDEGRMPRFKAYEVGAVDYLLKPIEPTILRSKVSVFVELAQKTAEVRRVAEVLRETEAREHTRQLLEREKEAAVMQQRWLEAVLDTLPTPLILMTPGIDRPRFANRAALSLAGGVFVGGARPVDFTLLNARRVPLEETEMPTHRAARGERLDGELFSFESPDSNGSVVAFTSRLPAQHGNTETVLLNLHDVSVLKRAEATLLEAIAAREDFIAVGSHELRTPITALKFQVRNAIKSWERPEALANPAASALDYLKQMQASVERLARLAEYLLDVSRLSSPEFQLKPTRFALEELVREVAQRPAEGAPVHAITVSADGDTTGVWDRARLEQLLDNLLDNARRYAAGPVELSVRGARDRVTLEVRDHGPGIAPEELPRLFERFARGRAQADDRRGFGLGLWIVSQLASHHGGSVSAQSTPGDGARFIVTLPRIVPALGASA
ncbi:MAG: hybrid sensor histidine kinase/response regulator [Archangium sp.]